MGRRNGVLLVVALAALAVTALGGASASARITSGQGGATLRTMGFGLPDEIARVRVDEAKRAIAPADVEMDTAGFSEQKFLSALAARNPPDLVYFGRHFVGTYASRNALMPLGSCIRNQRINVSQIRRAPLREVTFNGRIYAIPEFNSSRLIIINRRARIQARLSLRDFNTAKWANIWKVNRRLMRRAGGRVTRVGFDPKLPEFFPLWAKANGVDILSKDGRRAQIDHPKAIAALRFAVALINAHGGWGPFDSFRQTWDFFGRKNQVAENQIGAWPMEEFYFATLARNSPGVRIDVVPFRTKKGDMLNYTTGNAWAIPRGADNPGLACRWIKAMTRVESWLKAARARKAARRAQGAPFLPVWTANKVADRRIVRSIYEPLGNRDFNRAVRLILRVQDASFIVPPSAASEEVRQAWTDAVRRVLNRQQSVRAALRQADREAQRALDRARRG